MDQNTIYGDIAHRCGGDIYIGVVGPVRTGKSSFIKRFMELMVLPNMENEYAGERMRDELPQSGAGRTIMTSQPNFVPNEAAKISVGEGMEARVRLVDCVGYLIAGVQGAEDENGERMVRTPWFDRDIPFEEAAEIGTRKVISEHSTIGVVLTTDGSILDLPRSAYEGAESRVVKELQELEKPFVVVINSVHPQDRETQALKRALEEKYAAPVRTVDVQQMGEADIAALMKDVLYEFPIRQVRVDAPSWLTSLDRGHWLGKSVLETLADAAQKLKKVSDHEKIRAALTENEYTQSAEPQKLDLNMGDVEYRLEPKEGLFYRILGEASGQEIQGEEHLFELMKQLVQHSRAYQKLAPALESVEKCGYGVVLPQLEELTLSPPEIAREGGHYGVRLSAQAPSLHLVRVPIQANVSPIVGTQKQSQDLADSLAAQYREAPSDVWETEVFGKPLRDLARDEMGARLNRLSDDVREKLREALGKIINEGSGGMICILL